MTTKMKTLADTIKPIRPKTPEMEAHLGVGYGMTVKEAEQIISERKANPLAHSIEDEKKAKAFLAAYNAGVKELQPSSPKQGWKRSRDF